MNRILATLVLFGVGAFFAMGLRDGWRDGRMPLLVLSRITPWTFDRAQVPAWFWAATLANLAIAVLLTLCGILLLAVGTGR